MTFPKNITQEPPEIRDRGNLYTLIIYQTGYDISHKVWQDVFMKASREISNTRKHVNQQVYGFDPRNNTTRANY